VELSFVVVDTEAVHPEPFSKAPMHRKYVGEAKESLEGIMRMLGSTFSHEGS
jgi:hypothetical protein